MPNIARSLNILDSSMKNIKFTPWRFLLFVIALHLLGASLSFAASLRETSPLEASWRMALSGVDSKDSQTASKYVRFGLEARSRYHLLPDLYFALDPVMKFENGTYQSIDGKREGKNSLSIKEAAAHWNFLKGSDLSAGALNQSKTHSDLLVGDQAFPGVRADVQIFKIGNLQTLVTAEQAIPTSRSLSANTTGTEATPRFMSASLAAHYQTSMYHWKTRIGTYAFENLPTTVAKESGQRGNSVVALTEDEALFVYEFQGIEAMTSLRFPMMRGWDFISEASFLQNNKAESDLSRAYAASIGSEFFFIGRKSLDVKLTRFRIEPDAAVGYFTSGKYSYTNRAGYSFESFLNFNKYNVSIGARYSEADIIYLTPVQSREQTLMLILETSYAAI